MARGSAMRSGAHCPEHLHGERTEMKRIEVRGLLPPDLSSARTTRRMHQVYLGNGRRIYFNSAREARQFQADTNRMLNAQLHQLNYLLGQAFADYRAAWPLLLDGGKAVLGDVETRLRGDLQDAEQALDRAVRRTTGPNGMHFAWKYLGEAAGSVGSLFRRLGELYTYKTQGVQRHQVAMRERQAEGIQDQLRDYAMELTGAGTGATR